MSPPHPHSTKQPRPPVAVPDAQAQPWIGAKGAHAWPLLALAIYCLAFGVTRVLVSDSLELDEAEQALLSQWWLLGYSVQPPLYTWLQALVNAILGANVAALTLLRELLLFLTYLLVYLSANRVTGERRVATAATLALLLIPQFVWENQREHTHSLLVLCLAALTLYVVLRLLARPSLWGYFVLGLAAGFGTLAKYNYVLFAAALALALATLPAGRRLLFDRRVLLSITLGLLVVSPHALWLSDHLTLGADLLDKLQIQEEGDGGAARLARQMQTVIGFLTPFWLIALLVFRGSIPRAVQQPAPTTEVRLLGRYLVIVLTLLLATLAVLQAEQAKERWLQPLLFMAPIWLFAKIHCACPEPRRMRWFSLIGATAGVLALAVAGLRIPLAADTGVYTRLHLPVAEVASAIQRRGPMPNVLIAENYYLAGVLRLHLPEAAVYGPRASYRLPPLEGLLRGEAALLVWDATEDRRLPKALRRLAADAGYLGDGSPPTYVEALLKHSRDKRLRLGTAIVRKGPPAGPAGSSSATASP